MARFTRSSNLPEQQRALRWAALLSLLCSYCVAPLASAADPPLRVATYNTSLFRDEAGQLARDLAGGENRQARRIAEVIQRVRPEVMLVNEFDYDADGKAAGSFHKEYLGVGQNGCEPISFDHFFIAPSNTGVPTDFDMDNDGRRGGPADAIGFGRHEGQYGMLVLSTFPIDRSRIRTFQKFLWRDMPNAMFPIDPKTGEAFYSDEELAALRLSSKSFWDVPIQVLGEGGRKAFTLHLLCSHPTPPVFDGTEDRHGKRNHDEVRLVADYIGPDNNYLVDDAGQRGGLEGDALFVVLGDLNADPVDGEAVSGTMNQLLKHPRVDSSFVPQSAGGPLVVERHADQNRDRRGNPAHVTSDFTHEGHGNLRIDYALPSRGLKVVDGGIFWPAPGEPGSEAVTASDHRAVWIDVRPE